MKYILMFTLAMVVTLSGNAQMGKVYTAYGHLQEQQLDKAKAAIDEATTHEKSKDHPKTWLYRGQIYALIQAHRSTEGQFKDLDDQALEKAYASFLRCKELDQKGSFEKDIAKGLDDCRRGYFTEAAAALNGGDYPKAHELFKKTVEVSDLIEFSDTNSYFYGGQSAYLAEDYKGAIALLTRACDLKMKQGECWNLLASAHWFNGDTLGWKNTVEKGAELYPEYGGLITQLASYYVINQKYPEAKEVLHKAIEKFPDNEELCYNLGVVYDNLEEVDNAKTYYEKAIAMKPDYFDAIYNLGAMYYNYGVRIQNGANDIKDVKAYNKEKAKADETFKSALVYFEQAYALDPNDRNVLVSLQQIYTRLGKKDKLAEIEQRL
ncbi:MAG: tetratricopeptide repeat protein [Flavobacteriales bacterium]|nr:tetratricopeptide repeat protein [Flavobacteriales bacterium]